MENNIDMTHDDLSGRVFQGNFTPSASANKEHGTHVAGIIGAIQNTYGIAGIAKCSMYLLSRTDFVGSVTYAQENDIKIINASFGRKYNVDHFNALAGYDGLLIAAAGNSDYNNDDDIENHKELLYPASYDLPNIISVGASNSSGEIAEFENGDKSNYGRTTVDLFAPGVDIFSTIPNNKYWYKSGTSMAVPHVTGVAALIYAKCPDITASAVKKFILNNVDEVDDLKGKCVTGGKLNAYKAVNAAHTVHTESYSYYDEERHWVICGSCDYTFRIEAHTFKPYIPKGTSIGVNAIKAGKQCTKCYCIFYSDGTGQIIHKKDDKKI